MAKKFRTRAEKIRRQQKANQAPASFKITIGATMHEAPGDMDLAVQAKHQSRLLKAALLYADKVTLCSPLVRILMVMPKMARFSRPQKMEMLRLLAPTLSIDPSILEQVDQLTSLNNNLEQLWNSPELMQAVLLSFPFNKRAEAESALKTIRQGALQVEDVLATVNTTAANIASEWGVDNLAKLIQSGHVTLVNLGPSVSDVELISGIIQSSVHQDQMAKEGRTVGEKLSINQQSYIEAITEGLQGYLPKIINSSTEYPLFDEFTANLVRLGLQEGVFESSSLHQERARQIGLSANLLERLPMFDEASADEIIDIRKSLSRPLVKFRQAVMKYSGEMASEVWDPEFQLEAEKLFRSEVEPAVKDLETEMESNKYLLEIWRRVPQKPFAFTAGGSALGIALSQTKVFGETWFSLASTGVSAAILAADAWNQYKAKASEIEGNQLFFYVKAKQKLS